jgi:hypothetical protein
VMPIQPMQRTYVATTAALLLAGMLVSPALAAPEQSLLCEDDGNISLELTVTELSATPVNSNEEMLQGHLLKPRTDAAVRSAFTEESIDTDEVVDSDEVDVEEPVVADPGIPSASKLKPPIYKRQMYRRDI